MAKFIVIVNNHLFVTGKTPANADPATDPDLFSESIKHAYRFNRMKDAQFYGKSRPGKREIVEVAEMINTNKHTPGPWTIGTDKVTIIKPHPSHPTTTVGYQIAKSLYAFDAETREPTDETQANARLIAVAPAMYEALKEGRNTVKLLLAAIEAGKAEQLDGAEWLEFQRQAEAALFLVDGKEEG